MTATATFSEFLRTPKDVVAKLVDGDVLITRRGADDLLLSKAGAAEQESDTMSMLVHLIAASMDAEALATITRSLEEQFPWMTFLPEAARGEFVTEFLTTARACASIGRFGRLAILLSAWTETAEAYADQTIRPDGSDLHYLGGSDTISVLDPRTSE